jgi:hypothetical protein
MTKKVGARDFGVKGSNIFTATLDPGEAMSRIGNHPFSLFQTGTVIYKDDFSNPNGIISWKNVPDEFAFTGVLDQDSQYCASPIASARMQTGSPPLDFGLMALSIPNYPVRMGFEFRYSLISQLGDLDDFSVVCSINQRFGSDRVPDAKVNRVNIIYVATVPKLEIIDPLGTVEIANPLDVITSDVSKVLGIWHTVKLIVDFSTGFYSRLFIDDLEFDLSAYEMRDVASSWPGVGGVIELMMGVESKDNVTMSCVNFDSVIVTVNEP